MEEGCHLLDLSLRDLVSRGSSSKGAVCLGGGGGHRADLGNKYLEAYVRSGWRQGPPALVLQAENHVTCGTGVGNPLVSWTKAPGGASGDESLDRQELPARRVAAYHSTHRIQEHMAQQQAGPQQLPPQSLGWNSDPEILLSKRWMSLARCQQRTATGARRAFSRQNPAPF